MLRRSPTEDVRDEHPQRRLTVYLARLAREHRWPVSRTTCCRRTVSEAAARCRRRGHAVYLALRASRRPGSREPSHSNRPSSQKH